MINRSSLVNVSRDHNLKTSIRISLQRLKTNHLAWVVGDRQRTHAPFWTERYSSSNGSESSLDVVQGIVLSQILWCYLIDSFCREFGRDRRKSKRFNFVVQDLTLDLTLVSYLAGSIWRWKRAVRTSFQIETQNLCPTYFWSWPNCKQSVTFILSLSRVSIIITKWMLFVF